MIFLKNLEQTLLLKFVGDYGPLQIPWVILRKKRNKMWYFISDFKSYNKYIVIKTACYRNEDKFPVTWNRIDIFSDIWKWIYDNGMELWSEVKERKPLQQIGLGNWIAANQKKKSIGYVFYAIKYILFKIDVINQNFKKIHQGKEVERFKI